MVTYGIWMEFMERKTVEQLADLETRDKHVERDPLVSRRMAFNRDCLNNKTLKEKHC